MLDEGHLTIVAAAFFVTYEAMKSQIPKISPMLSSHEGLNHMLSASVAEFVSNPPGAAGHG